MKVFKTVWNWLSGKKTAIGLLLHIGWAIANIANKDLTNGAQYWEIHGYIGTVSGGGLAHKAVKNKNKIADKINNIGTKLKKGN